MTKETFTVPAFEVTLERTDNPNFIRMRGGLYALEDMREVLEEGILGPVLYEEIFTAALAYLDANKPDPKPGFTVRHEVDGEWKWTAIFNPDPYPDPEPWFLNGRGLTDGGWMSRDEFAALCERDGVTL